jgi:hypothetical protein
VSTWVRGVRRVAIAVGVAALIPVVAPGCSVGDGSGTVSGTLDVPDCWSGLFNLNPDFFAADPYDNSVTIRVQSGGDYANFSDGLSILVDNVHEVRGDAPFSPSLLNHPLKVDLAAGVAIAGAPVIPQADPALVHITVYVQKSCPTQNVALYALESVSLDADGNCNPAATGPYILQCNAPSSVGYEALADAGPDALPFDATTLDATTLDATTLDASTSLDANSDAAQASASEAGTVLPASAPVGHSTITFQSLFDGNEDESSAAERLTQARFKLYLADPRDACPGGLGPPPPCRGFLSGNFQFYFQRGRPGQPFP